MSRSGRIRKKSSKLTDFESVDETNAGFYKKKNMPLKYSPKALSTKVDEFDSEDSDSQDSDSDIDMKDDSLGFGDEWEENVDPSDILDDLRDDDDDDDDDDEDDEDDFDQEDGLHVDEDATASRDDSNYNQANSAYFSEKKKASAKELKNVKKKKSERKDKGKARFTAYMLWARESRPKIVEENALMDFSAVNKRLGELWSLVPYAQKHNWKRKAKKLEARGEKPKPGNTMISTGKGGKGGHSNKSSLLTKGRLQTMYGSKSKNQSKPQPLTQNNSLNSQKQSYQTPKSVKVSPNPLSDLSPPTSFKVTGTSPIDVAAHLKLLGESLNNIGQKLKEHEGQIAVSGSLSVLLDSMLCVLGPLACLSNQLEETKGAISDQTLSGILDNIAYIMPGIV